MIETAERRLEDKHELVLQTHSLTKSFSNVVANDEVNFSLRRGEVHAILGENGAGKSTLASMLSGLYSPDSGTIQLNGQFITLDSPRDALTLGIGMVYQHFRLIEDFTVTQNILLAAPEVPWLLRRKMEKSVSAMGQQYGLSVNPSAKVGRLSLGERQKVEIIKMLFRGIDVLVLDEPTAVLTPQEVQSLFATIRDMARQGKSVVIIAHKLREVLEVSDRITVMRQGRVVGTVDTPSVDSAVLSQMMMGQPLGDLEAEPRPDPGRVVLKVRDLTLNGPPNARLEKVSLDVRAGEIVAIAGVSGNGQLQLAESIVGLLSDVCHGSVEIDGRDVSRDGIRQRRECGLSYVPEDRLGGGLAPGLNISDNLQLTRTRGWRNRRMENNRSAETRIRDFNIKASGPGVTVGTLSGGNVQKVLLAREITGNSKVLVVASPTRGLDVSAHAFVHEALERLRAAGCAILLISEDLDEIRALADNVLVLHAGKVHLRQSISEWDVNALGMAMTGLETP